MSIISIYNHFFAYLQGPPGPPGAMGPVGQPGAAVSVEGISRKSYIFTHYMLKKWK